jgi:hypothetical protein
MRILAIDPGTVQSALVIYNDEDNKIEYNKIIPNEAIAHVINNFIADVLVVEMFKSYGMSVGDSVLQTCVWIGRFQEAWKGPSELIYRKTVVSELCGTATANDSNIRNAVIDYFSTFEPQGILGVGVSYDRSKKRKPASLRDISKDLWSAVAIAIAWSDIRKRKCKMALKS